MANPENQQAFKQGVLTFAGHLPETFIADSPDDPKVYQESRDLVVDIPPEVVTEYYQNYRDRIDNLFIEWVSKQGMDPRFLWNEAGRLYDEIIETGTDYEAFLLSGTKRPHFQNAVWLNCKEKLEIINPEHNRVDELFAKLDIIALESALEEYGLEAEEPSKDLVLARSLGSLSLV